MEAAADSAAQAILLAIGLSVMLGVIGFFYAGDILRLMGGEENLVQSGVGYTRII